VSESTPVNSDQIAERFASRLRELRQWRGLSQETLAEQASEHGVTLLQTTVAKIENGQRAVRIEEAWALSRALGVTFDDFMYDPADSEASDDDLERALEETIRLRVEAIKAKALADKAAAQAAMDADGARSRQRAASQELARIEAGMRALSAEADRRKLIADGDAVMERAQAIIDKAEGNDRG
jgi:transcriptional regulator with XRE-family HTH domain